MDEEDSERFQREVIEAELPADGALEEDDDEDPYYFVRQVESGRGDIYLAARTGDLKRLQYLVQDEGVDVNKRDRWDAVPLYYSCLAGHPEVAKYLLEEGAVCNEFTFDGDRCHYAALTMDIRMLLRQYEQRPPPLSPLATDLRLLWDSQGDTSPSTACADNPWCDLIIRHSDGHAFLLHRVILAARSPFFRRRLGPGGPWAQQEAGVRREVHLRGHEALSMAALRALLAYLYTERVDVPVEEVEALARLVRKCRLPGLAQEMKAERETHRYYFKSTRREDLPRRFVLHPGALPPEARLFADLGRIRDSAAALEAAGVTSPDRDFADLLLGVGEGSSRQMFRAHGCILTARWEWFRLLLDYADVPGAGEPRTPATRAGGPDTGPGRTHFSPDVVRGWPPSCVAGGDPRGSPGDFGTGRTAGLGMVALEIRSVEPRVFELMLRFIYTDRLEWVPHDLLRPDGLRRLIEAADFHLLMSMKRAVAECLIASWEVKPPGSLAHICKVLEVADTFRVMPLREHCLRRMAHGFDRVASGRAGTADHCALEAFVVEQAPEEGDLLDGSALSLGREAFRGTIGGESAPGLGMGTLLQDLREAYLEDHKGDGQLRDKLAADFDRRLMDLYQRALAAS